MTMAAAVMVYALLLAAAALYALRYVRLAGGGFPSAGRIAVVLLAAAALFWFLETAILRRMAWPGEVFSLVGDARLQAGRAVRMTVCLGLGLFFGMTGGGERLLSCLTARTRKNGALWVLSLALTVLFFLWAGRITVIHFMTNDDTSLMMTIAATAENGATAAGNAFASPLFCLLLGLLYRLDPAGTWYAWYHLAVLGAACMVTGRCILLKLRGLGVSLFWGLSTVWLCFLGFWLPAVAELSFTVTPAAAGTAAAALLFCRGDESLSRGGRVASDVLTVLLTLLCWLHRRATGRALLCFLALVLVYGAVVLLRSGRRRMLWGLAITAAAACSLLAGCAALQSAVTVTAAGEDYNDYWEAEYYRSIVMDYLNGKLTAGQLEAAGIPPELGNLLFKQWYFMDERVNTDTFRLLTEMYYHPEDTAEGGSESLAGRLSGAWRDEPGYLPSLYALTAAAGVLALFCLTRFIRRGRDGWPELLCALGALGGGGILCLYLLWQGRMLFRVFLVAALPALVILLLCGLTGRARPLPRGAETGTRAVMAVCAGALAALAFFIAAHVPYAVQSVDRETVFRDQYATEDYAEAHPSLYFVTNFSAQNLDPFHSASYPGNMHLWGGTGVTAQPDEDRLYADAFFRGDVRFMCKMPGSVMLLLQYLTLDHGPVAALEEVSLTDDITVFDIQRILPAEGADGWFEWNGLQYYFLDGQALAGTQVIDGQTREFSPSGAAAAMFLKDTDEGRYYVTNAFTLVEGAQ